MPVVSVVPVVPVMSVVRARQNVTTVDRKPWQFQPGNPGGGRPRGARSRLQEFTLQLIEEDFREHGADVLKRVREKWPQVYLSAVTGLLPRQQQTIESPLADLTDEELAMLEEMLAAGRAKLIEQHKGAAAALEPADTKQQPSYLGYVGSASRASGIDTAAGRSVAPRAGCVRRTP